MFAAVFAVLLATAVADRNPCHSKRYEQGNDVPCEVITLPPKLCPACKLRPLGYQGNFKDCSNIYNLDDGECRAQLVEYAKLNPCDKRRGWQTKDISANREALDYFTYSICEECCDCITMGSQFGQYGWRKAAGTLFKEDRGNCPAHGHYDICRVWPNVKHVKSPWENTPSNLWSMPKVCPLFRDWKFGPHGQNWYNKQQVYISSPIRTFLKQFLKAAQCSEQSFWNDCMTLEKSQNRV